MKLEIEFEDDEYREIMEDLLDLACEQAITDEKYTFVILNLIRILFKGEESIEENRKGSQDTEGSTDSCSEGD